MQLKKNIILLIFLSLIARLSSAYFFHDLKIENEWGILLNNLVQFQTYAFYTEGNFLIPSVLMPPLYAYFIYAIKILTFSSANFIYILIFVQIIVSTLSVYFFYKINVKIFSENICLINSYIFCLFPLNVYAAGQISSITLQIFLLIIFFLFTFKLSENKNLKNHLLFSLLAGLLILIRGEFILILFFTLFYLLIKKKIKIKSFILLGLVTLLFISPYLVRNYNIFNKIILVKSLGINLWKGNNEFSKIQGYENLENENFLNIKNKIEGLEKDIFYELKRDKIFLHEGLKNIKEKPFNYSYLFLKKIFSFYFFDFQSNYPNYYNLFHILPILVISVVSFLGLILTFKKKEFKLTFLKNYMFLTIIIFSIFFILPRYKLTILPVQIIFAGYFIEYLLKKKFTNTTR